MTPAPIHSCRWDSGASDPLVVSLEWRGDAIEWKLDDYGGRDRNEAWGRTESCSQPLDKFYEDGPWEVAMRETRLQDLRAGLGELARMCGRGEPAWFPDFELIVAAVSDNYEKVAVLLKNGVKPDRWVGGMDALGLACRTFMLKSALFLIEAGAEVNRSYKGFLDQPRTPLFWTIENGRYHDDAVVLVDALIRHGADIGGTDEKGESALIFAVRHDKPPFRIVRRLLEAGANPNALGGQLQPHLFDEIKAGYTALYAVFLRDETTTGERALLIRMLKENGATVDRRTHCGGSTKRRSGSPWK